MIERQPGKYERLSVERHERDLALAARPEGHPRGFTFDAAAGERVVEFIETYCRHHKAEWAGQLLKLEDWQKFCVRTAFGWKRPDGTRRFRIIYIELPRKNGKTELAAALGLYLLVPDDEPGAEVYSSATKKDQAKILWDASAEMVKASPGLKRFVKAYRSNLSCARLGSKFEPLGADSSTLDGLNPHGNLIDELHAHKDRGVWDVMATAMGSRRQPMTIAITTAGSYDPESIGWEMHELAIHVLEGIIEDERLFAFIATADEGEETEKLLKANPEYYFTEEAQKKANPNYGISVKLDDLAEQAQDAKNKPGFLNEYLRLRLNVWTRTVNRWLSMERWAECDPPPAPDVDVRKLALEREAQLKGRTCYGGLDLSNKLDLASLVLLFPGEGKLLDVVCRFWLPEATIANYARKGQRHFELWARQGWIIPTQGEVIDYDWIRAEVAKLAAFCKIIELAYDSWAATETATKLRAKGLTMVECGQGYKSMSEPTKELEARVVAKQFRHANNPVLRFCASNAVVTRDPAGNMKPDKAHAKSKIDGIVASVMALSRIIVTPVKPPSRYATAGFRTL